jgi:hypothetical protein
MPPENPEPDFHRREAQKLLNEGWIPHPFQVGALCRKGINRPSVHVAPYLWEAMRLILNESKPA